MDYKLEVVVVPVSDVDRAKAFYVDRVGFVLDVDHQPNEEFRVVQMTPRGSGCSVTIGTGLAKMAPGSLTGLQLSVADIGAAHADLASRGVPVSAIQHHDGAGSSMVRAATTTRSSSSTTPTATAGRSSRARLSVPPRRRPTPDPSAGPPPREA
jgi:catechol 2,3-dioxygenase-like lactoylglutathione lyase family enzyme